MYTSSRRRNNSGVFQIAILVFVVLALIGGVWMYGRISKAINKVSNPTSVKRQERNVYTVLLMGYGGGNHDGAYLTDSMMLVRIDTKAKTADIISLPRDLWVKLPTRSGDEFASKINAVYQMSLFPTTYPDVKQGKEKAELIKKTVSDIVGFPVHYIVTVDFDGFEKAIDELGGVVVNVPRAFDDYEYPITGKEKDLCGREEKDLPDLEAIAATQSAVDAFPCRYEHLHFDKGITKMDGATALKFVRSRHGLIDGGDFGRATRQQLFIDAVKDHVLSINFISKIFPLMDTLSDHVTTDIPNEDAKKLISELPKAQNYTRRSLVLSTDNALMSETGPGGAYILASNDGLYRWNSTRRVVADLIAGKDASASSHISNAPPKKQ